MQVRLRYTTEKNIKSIHDLSLFLTCDKEYGDCKIVGDAEAIKKDLIQEEKFSVYHLSDQDFDTFSEYLDLIINKILESRKLQNLPLFGHPGSVSIPHNLLEELEEKRDLKDFVSKCKLVRGTGSYRPEHW